MDGWTRYFGGAVGFGFGLLWMTTGLGSAIACLLLAGLGYGVAFTAERARASGSAFRLAARTPDTGALRMEGDDTALESDLPIYEPYETADDASSPLAAEADYGWPVAEPELAHTESA